MMLLDGMERCFWEQGLASCFIRGILLKLQLELTLSCLGMLQSIIARQMLELFFVSLWWHQIRCFNSN